MNKTKIEWSNYTSNPLQYRDPEGNVVHACIHKSAGCLHCYAETLAPRYGRKGMPFTAENMKRLTPFLNEKELHSMLTCKPASGKMCFVGDMTDLFGEWVPFELLDKLFAVFALRPDVTWQVLTKRPERMRQYCNKRAVEMKAQRDNECSSLHAAFPDALPNVWLGTSVENQPTADERIPIILQTPAAVRFVSYEPALGPVEFDCGPGASGPHRYFSVEVDHPEDRRLDWVIVGGESGNGARPFNIQWARDVIAQCKAAGVPVFVKQFGAKPFLKFERSHHEERPGFKLHVEQLQIDTTIRLKDRKGGEMAEWPEDLRVREFPEMAYS